MNNEDYEKLLHKIRNIITLIINNSDNFHEKHIETMFNSDNLPLKKR